MRSGGLGWDGARLGSHLLRGEGCYSPTYIALMTFLLYLLPKIEQIYHYLDSAPFPKHKMLPR